MTTDDADELEAGSEQRSDLDSDSEPNPDSDSDSNSHPSSTLDPDSDSDSDSSDVPSETESTPTTESGISLERTTILVCLAGTIVGSTLPWISLPDITVYGFETYGLATIAIATATGAFVYASDWSKRAMGVTFVSGLLIASIAFAYVLFGGIGALVTLVSGVVLAFTGLVGYDNRR
ncbi:hypothetical protein OB955_03845 [Halobacteria archaeon AArc-m2/3/4]|uniref:Uncharacterized protein n=1 Tax=Natronoglomus mannanivorans TaxID=2979990 RepID=A0AAP3E2I1_9EURY|nr:hypothetical protein [Halobacteria archaeon AArc-xg1-1]MCU4971870.1 hypothetical protein [Halobacteria archaeon AArc-m2/3/4]